MLHRLYGCRTGGAPRHVLVPVLHGAVPYGIPRAVRGVVERGHGRGGAVHGCEGGVCLLAVPAAETRKKEGFNQWRSVCMCAWMGMCACGWYGGESVRYGVDLNHFPFLIHQRLQCEDVHVSVYM